MPGYHFRPSAAGGMLPMGMPPSSQPQLGSQPQPQPHLKPYKGTLPPGTKVVVGDHLVTVQRYLAQGGFAHIYLVKSKQPIPVPTIDSQGRRSMKPETTHVLKRMAVPDKPTLALVRGEVEAHRLLHGHTHIVHFIEASATALPKGGYEVFILMEYCSAGGIIDLMNQRLRDRLREPEVLKIFGDVCEGLAVMHHLDPPLMHRDLKIENVLICPPPAEDPSLGPIYKLADFGSASPVLSRRAPKSLEEIKRVEADLNRATTLQYRAPEMVDVYQRRVIDEKADIWAMGVFLYKLCYYTTPFEENGGGPLAILNARYRFPPSPVYSSNLKNLIGSMLKEKSHDRPTIDQLIVRTYELRGLKPPTTATRYAQLTAEGKQLPAMSTTVVTKERRVVPGSQDLPSSLDDSTLASSLHPQRPERTSAGARTNPAATYSVGRLVHVDSSDAIPTKDPSVLRESIQPMRRGRPSKESLAQRTLSPSTTYSATVTGVGGTLLPELLHDDPSPAPETVWPGLRKTKPYTVLGSGHLTPSRTPVEDGFADSFAPASTLASRTPSTSTSTPTPMAQSPSPSPTSAPAPASTPALLEASKRFPSLEELDATKSVAPTTGKVTSRTKQFEQATQSSSTPSSSDPSLPYQPRKSSSATSTTTTRAHATGGNSVKDRWPPAATKGTQSPVTTRSQAIQAARTKVEAEANHAPTPSLPVRSGSNWLSSSPTPTAHTHSLFPPQPQSQSEPEPEPEVKPEPATPPAAPPQDWLTGSEDLLIDTAPSPIAADDKPEPGRRTNHWPDPVAASAASRFPALPDISSTSATSPPAVTTPAADDSSDEDQGPEPAEGNPYAQKEVRVSGKINPPPWVITGQQEPESQPVPPPNLRTEPEAMTVPELLEPQVALSEVEPMEDDGRMRPPRTLSREFSFDLGMHAEDAMDLALIEGQIPSDALVTGPALSFVERAPSGTESSTEQQLPIPTEGSSDVGGTRSNNGNGVNGAKDHRASIFAGPDYGEHPPIKAPSFDEDSPHQPGSANRWPVPSLVSNTKLSVAPSTTTTTSARPDTSSGPSSEVLPSPSHRPSPSSSSSSLVVSSSFPATAAGAQFASSTNGAASPIHAIQTGAVKNRLHDLINVANERDVARTKPAPRAGAGSGTGTGTGTSGIVSDHSGKPSTRTGSEPTSSAPTPAAATAPEPMSSTSHPTPTLVEAEGTTTPNGFPAGATSQSSIPSVADRMRELKLSKSADAAKRGSTSGSTSSPPTPSSPPVRPKPSSRRSTSLSQPAPYPIQRPKPQVVTKPTTLQRSSTQPKPPVAPKPASLKPWEREAAAAEAIQKSGVVRSDMKLLDGKNSSPPEPEQDPPSPVGAFKGVNSLINRWQHAGQR